jgi:HlyD family secretion protein
MMKINLDRITSMKIEPHRVMPIALVLVGLIALGIWYFGFRPAQRTEALTASGTIAITQVQIGSELGGRVVAIKVDEGDAVEAGDVLVQLDTTTLQDQRAQAQASYDLLVSGGTPEQRSARIAAAELQLLIAQQALQDLHDGADMALAQAKLARADALDALDKAEYQWYINQPGNRYTAASLQDAKADVKITEKRLSNARKNLDKAEGTMAKSLAQNELYAAERAYYQAVWLLDWLQADPTEIELAQLDADLELAKANLANAERDIEKLADGPDPDALALAEAKLKNAQEQLDLAKADPGKEELVIAQAAVDLLDTQIDKMTITAPADGVILTRVIQTGEIVLPSSTLMVLGVVDEMTITVYVPEDRYGEITIGQKASVSVDSFPGISFEAVVTAIADQAEFTPRNVQTVEGRKNTVFAIDLRVTVDDRLKAGMPADVIFK